MAFHWSYLLLLGICCHCICFLEAATVAAGHYAGRSQLSHEYWPPLTKEDYDEKPQQTQLAPTATTYTLHTKPKNPVDTFQTQPQLGKKKSNPSNIYQKVYNSYAPPASGAAPFQYSAPQASHLVPLPALLPKSLFEHISKSATAPLQQQQQQMPTAPSTDAPPVLMIEQPPATFLTPNQNRTLQAARILANTLLEANGEPPLEEPSALSALSQQSPPANTTDVLIVKSQKHAYIIPTALAKEARRPNVARALYQMRDQLEKAYTVNQFIFIIKPQRINFLNKLV